MSNPYDTLGVDKSADKEQIKRAYRGKAHKAHPDKGGSSEEFNAVVRAYELLSDDMRRKHFDETGEDPDAAGRSGLLDELASLLFSMIDQCPDVESHNLIQASIDVVNQAMAATKEGKRGHGLRINKLRQVAKRITRKSGENILRSMVEAEITKLEALSSQFDEKLEIHQALLEQLASYSYEVTKKDSADDELRRRLFESARNAAQGGALFTRFLDGQ